MQGKWRVLLMSLYLQVANGGKASLSGCDMTLLRRRNSAKDAYLPYSRLTGVMFHIRSAYWLIVRSLENFPMPAMFRMARRDHSSGSR